ncbi:UNVERIFIED_CONTAM: 7-deoxyloganetin glucosyltransferase [Sesamum angustifolium]|uniref:7-deoxyloganetin glucosyltransferase n=1 Tax=Sesamum angustifolium TaxID=2727405 RepID=A0AAW2MHK3_9LAMI
MASSPETCKKPHAVLVPFPTQGHLNPFLKLAKLLHHTGFHITYVNTEFNHTRLLNSKGSSVLEDLPDFCFETIPDGLPPSDSDATQSMMAFTLEAALEIKCPYVMFWTFGVCVFLSLKLCADLTDRGITPFKDSSYLTDGSLETVVDWVPGLKNFRFKNVASFIQTTNPNDYMLVFLKGEIEAISRASAIILYTFHALERDLLDTLSPLFPPIYAIGPLQPLVDQISAKTAVSSMDFSLWRADDECMEWLSSKEQNSVIYVNFGSIAVLTPSQIQELALGLAESKKNFLWILRPDLIKGNSGILPPDFTAETKDRGLILSWCRQEKVLNHPSIGGFLTHCGWNSVIEGITAGVPFLCLPQVSDQPANCWSICSEWEIGLEISKDFKKEEVGAAVRELLDGENGREMKKRAMDWKKQAAEATASPHGSSSVSLERLVKEVLLK